MRWLKRDMWKVGIAIAGMLLLLVLMVWVPVSAAGAHERAPGLAGPVTGTVQATPTMQATPTIDPTIVAATAKEQLRKLEHDNDRSFQAWFWSSGATFLSTLVLVSGALIGFWQWRVNRNDTHTKESKDRQGAQDKELEDRKAERVKRAEERFQSAVTGLGDEEKEGARIGAAILLRTFLHPGYEQFYVQTFDLTVANLRLRRNSNSKPLKDQNTVLPLDSLSQALIMVFIEAFPLARKQNTRSPAALDAGGMQLDSAYLRGADLEQAWMSETFLRKADLREAHLNGAQLNRVHLNRAKLNGAELNKAKLRGANLSGAKLINVKLKEADLSEATLYKADLSGADLSGANLSKVHQLEDALSLKDTILRGVTGLTNELLEACKTKGAIIDEDTTTSSPQSTVSPSLSSQSNDVQSPLAIPAQGNLPTPDTGISSATSSQQGPEP